MVYTRPKIRILISFFAHISERIRETEPPILSLYCCFDTMHRDRRGERPYSENLEWQYWWNFWSLDCAFVLTQIQVPKLVLGIHALAKVLCCKVKVGRYGAQLLPVRCPRGPLSPVRNALPTRKLKDFQAPRIVVDTENPSHTVSESIVHI